MDGSHGLGREFEDLKLAISTGYQRQTDRVVPIRRHELRLLASRSRQLGIPLPEPLPKDIWRNRRLPKPKQFSQVLVKTYIIVQETGAFKFTLCGG